MTRPTQDTSGGDWISRTGLSPSMTPPFQTDSAIATQFLIKSYYPGSKMDPVWALPLSLAATYGIDFSFCSSGYLDVSVLQVGYMNLWIQFTYVRESTGQLLFNGSP